MNFKEHTFVLDDITKAHVCIKTEVPSIIASTLYESLVAQSGTDELNIKVAPNEIADFITNLAEEIKARRYYLNSQKKMRVSDVKDKPELLNRANIVLALPRTLANQNLAIIKNMLMYTVPLDIHFYIVLPDDAKSKVAEPIIDCSYWLLDLDSNTLQHK